MIDAPIQAEPISEVDRLRQEIADLISSGIVEIAARNPDVLEYMRHWEGRAEKAEARVRKLEEALRIALPYVEAQVNDDGGIDNCEIGDRLAYEARVLSALVQP